jgi:molybdopterin-guanine dinucleotide biosynthesis protein A
MTGYVLAGGLSRRFGSDKALFPIDGEPLAVRTARILAVAGLAPVLLVARTSRPLGLIELLEPDGPRHPLWGVAFALSKGEDAFFSPCDLPELSVEQVRALHLSGSVALGQPLLGVLPVTRAADARAAALAGGSVRAFVAGLPVLDVGPVPNLNTPG